MANTKIFGHLLDELNDGVTVFREGVGKPMPLTSTHIDVNVKAGLAIVVTTRLFSNAEDVPIEAILTMPVGFHAVVTGLIARIDGRELRAIAKAQEEARETYEEAIDQGKTSILHEEALRGIHVLSVGQLAPGKEVSVELRMVVPLSVSETGPFLRIPMTAGQLYGASPLQPADDLIADDTVHHAATLTVHSDAGVPNLIGFGLVEPGQSVQIALDRAIECVVEGGTFGSQTGISADGRQVQVTLRPQSVKEAPLKLAILVDRSGSTASTIADGSETLLSAMRNGLSSSLAELTVEDHIAIWQFGDDCQRLGTGRGAELLPILKKLDEPSGGTKLAAAITKVAASGIKDILILTDGQTWDKLQPLACDLTIRVSAVLVGEASLDANVGHLCAMTGGDLFYAPDAQVSACVRLAMNSKRSSAVLREIDEHEGRPIQLRYGVGGVDVTANWTDEIGGSGDRDVGRFAAGLCLGQLTEEAGITLALAEGLCSQATSLILVDDAGEASEGLSETRKIPLMAAPSRLLMAASASAPQVDSVRCYISDERLALRRTITDVPKPRSKEEQIEYLAGLAARRAGANIWLTHYGKSAPDDAPSNAGRRAEKQKQAAIFLATIAEGIDWDGQINRFLAYDFSGLMPNEEAVIRALVEREAVALIVAKTTINPRILMLAWLADRFVTHSRAAHRFANKVLGQIEDQGIIAEIDGQTIGLNAKGTAPC